MLGKRDLFGKATLLLAVAVLAFSWSVSAKPKSVSGVVRCNGKGVAGVVVSDGVNVTKTNGKGAYSLPTDCSAAQFVHISIPSGYEVRRDGSIPQFFGRIEQGAAKQQFDFELTKVDQSHYTLMTMADTHILGGASRAGCVLDVERYTTSLLPEINNYAAKLNHPVYMVHLGDIGLRYTWKSKRGGYTLADYVEDTKLNMPVFNIMGNHDHNVPEKGECFGVKDTHLSRATFHTSVGPSYYSFNIGREHYVVLDNSLIITSDSGPTMKEDAVKGYQYRVDEQQMAWLKQDVAQLDAGKVDKIVVLVHCPILLNDTKFRMMYAERFLDTFEGYDVLILAGHSHSESSIRRQYNGKSLIQNVHTSTAGTFWYTPWSCDGAPGGSVAYHFGNESITRTPVAWGEAVGKTHFAYDNAGNKWHYSISSLTAGGISHHHDLEKAVPKNRKALVVNIFGAYECDFTESTGGKGSIAKNLYDLNFRDWYWAEFDKSMNGEAQEGFTLQNPGHQRPKKSPHVWRYIPKDSNAEISVVAKDVFGNVVVSFKTKIAE